MSQKNTSNLAEELAKHFTLENDRKLLNRLRYQKEAIFETAVQKRLKLAIEMHDKKFINNFGDAFSKIKTWRGNYEKNLFLKCVKMWVDNGHDLSKKGEVCKFIDEVNITYNKNGKEPSKAILPILLDVDYALKVFKDFNIIRSSKTNTVSKSKKHQT